MLAFVGLICCVLFVNLDALPADYPMIQERMLPVVEDQDSISYSDSSYLKILPAMVENGTFGSMFQPNQDGVIQVAPPYLPMN